MTTIAYLASVLAHVAPYRPHAVIGVLGDGSTGTLRLHFTEPATAAEAAYVVELLAEYVPLPFYVETVVRARVDLPLPFLGFHVKDPR